MIEAYAFLAAFPVQILAMSVLYPAWFVRRARAQAASIPGISPSDLQNLVFEVERRRRLEAAELV